MERNSDGQLKGQTSINELLEEPVGVAFIQMVLPLYVQLSDGKIRHV